MIPVSRPSIGPDEHFAVQDVVLSGQVTQGPKVLQFEAGLAHTLGVKSWQVIACSSGTAALHLALAALDLKPGDEVLVPDLTYVATANAVRYVGATPVLVDVDPVTWNINLKDAFEQLTPRTKAIIPVHLYGVPCDMQALHDFAFAFELAVVEDAAEAFGARSSSGQRCGTIGRFGTFSFYGNKIITTGEGGAVIAQAEDDALRVRSLRGQAQAPSQRFFHTEVGFNYRMSDLHAALGVAQLRRFEELWAGRFAAMDVYLEELRSFESSQHRANKRAPHVRNAPWLFTFLVPSRISRDAVAARLLEDGIETRPAFVPLHRMPMYAAHQRDFVNASRIADRGLSLPTYSELSEDQAWMIVRRVLNHTMLPVAL